MFQRILVANRGEIALRVIRACRDLGIEVVAVFSEADRSAPYLRLADDAICIGPAAAAESYLRIDRIISAAELTNVEAIHPGYGFLSENAHFAEVCRECKIEFIGPPAEAMRQLGNKNAARKMAQQAGVLLLDEPTTYLDLRHQIEVLDVVRELATGHGIACGLVLHDLGQAAAYEGVASRSS